MLMHRILLSPHVSPPLLFFELSLVECAALFHCCSFSFDSAPQRGDHLSPIGVRFGLGGTHEDQWVSPWCRNNGPGTIVVKPDGLTSRMAKSDVVGTKRRLASLPCR